MPITSEKFIVPALVATWAALLSFGLVYLDVRLDWLAEGLLGLIILGVITTLDTRRVVFALIFLAMFLNVANYSFLTYTAEGEMVRTAESEILAVLRLPIVFLVLVVVGKRYGPRFASFLRLNWDLLLFVILPFLGAAFASDLARAAQYALWMMLTLLAIMALVFVLQAEVPRWRWAEFLGWLTFASSFLMVIFAVVGLPDVLGGTSRMVGASFGSAAIYSQFSAVVLASVLMLERQKSSGAGSALLRRIPTWILAFVALLTSVPLLFGGKRSAIVSAALVLVAYSIHGLVSRTGGRSTAARAAVVVGIVAVAVVLLLPRAENTMFRFERTFDPDRNASVQRRFEIVEWAVPVFEEDPIFGIGLSIGSLAVGYGLHNTYLGVVLELGIVGALVFLLLLFRSFRAWRLCSTSLRWAIVYMAIPPVLISVTEYSLTPGQALFWPLWLSILAPRLSIGQRNLLAADSGQVPVREDPNPD